MFKLYFDGASKKNPGISGIGFSIENSKNEEIFSKGEFFSEKATNNEAEYEALYKGLLMCLELKIKNLEVYGDSNLVIKQMTDEYKTKAENLILYKIKCSSLSKHFESINFNHIYRKDNKRADFLANKAINSFHIKDEKTWESKLVEWLSGIPQEYPTYIEKPFFYETYPIDKNLHNNYKEKFIETENFNIFEQDYGCFLEHIENSSNEYVTSFFNPSKTTKLIIPIPKNNKNFKTMKDFIDNSSNEQQVEFWKNVAIEIINLLDFHDKIYVSTHGLGVLYFHLRLDLYPKYYITEDFKN
jgi:ribonuclease HI